jgi:hypothetical protein
LVCVLGVRTSREERNYRHDRIPYNAALPRMAPCL